jgi:hypothetical protein
MVVPKKPEMLKGKARFWRYDIFKVAVTDQNLETDKVLPNDKAGLLITEDIMPAVRVMGRLVTKAGSSSRTKYISR